MLNIIKIRAIKRDTTDLLKNKAVNKSASLFYQSDFLVGIVPNGKAIILELTVDVCNVKICKRKINTYTRTAFDVQKWQGKMCEAGWRLTTDDS